MSEEEKVRIKSDYSICKGIEDSIFSKIMDGKKDIIVFNPAIYEIESYMKKYSRDEVGKVFGFLNTSIDAKKANDIYGLEAGTQNAFYVGNMEDKNFGSVTYFVGLGK